MLTRPRYAAAGVATVGLIVFAGWLIGGWGGPAATRITSCVGLIAISVFAVACVATACLRSDGPQRFAWLCFSLGLLSWVIGTLIWATWLIPTNGVPYFPSVADAFRLVFPITTCITAVFAPSTGGRTGVRVFLDGVIASSAVFIVVWTLGLNDVFRDADPRGINFVVSVAYPFVDVAMVIMFAAAVVKTPRGRRLSPSLCLAGVIAIWLTDNVYLYLVANPHDGWREVVVLGWALAMYLISLGALTLQPLQQLDVTPRKTPSSRELWLPYLPVPFAFLFGTAAVWPSTPQASFVVVTGVILVAAALLRQLTLLAENRDLLVTVANIALRDPLTGLPNRALFADRLAHAMQLRLRRAAPVTVLLLDLDDFKLVNDSLGHSAGDALLRSVGDRILNSLRGGDTVARLGGDEFAVLIEDEPEIARIVADRVVEAFGEPFVVDDREVFVRPSVGMASASSSDGITGDDLFRRADLAMYSAKRAHFSGVRMFTSDMRHDATELQLSQRSLPGRRGGVARIQLLGDLRHAIEERQLTLVYQPKFSLATGAVVGVEALVRWPHPELGLLEPADFLPLARHNGLMDAVTDLVLTRAVGEAARWYDAGLAIPVAINLSAPSLDDETLPDRILAVLGEFGMPPDSLSVEITEDQLLHSVARTRTVLHRLRHNGIRIAIDDFGSGYANMTYLHELPIDELKLDRQFVAPILYDDRAATIVRSVIELACAFGLASVAEGVENQATADRLREYGCGYVQGRYLSPPVSAESINLGAWRTRLTDDEVRRTAADRPSSA